MTNIIQIEAREAILKRRFRAHLRNLGFRKNSDGELEAEGSGKDVIRQLHSGQRSDKLSQNRQFIKENYNELSKYFATGNEIDPHNISPVLERLESRATTTESKLFRFASLTWSVPVSNGFGRRIRYLVWDENNGKLIGLIAIGDPVFNLSVRDKLIGWSHQDRSERLVNIMDAYVLGAVAPYNMLLGGKLIASLVRSRDIYKDFQNKYGNTEGIISGQKKKAKLLAVMTSSSLGRSSIYNRLKLDGTPYFRSIGYTSGWGHFHIPDKLFSDLRNYLRDIEHPYADLHQYGQGPNWRLRTTRAALEELGFKDDLLKHGVQREVFISEFATNSLKILKTGKGRPDLTTLLPVTEVAELALERWVVPRSIRRSDYLDWTLDDLRDQLRVRPKMSPQLKVAK
jgi:hypothetical protein